MVDVAELLRTAHDARQRQDWPAAYERFTTARLVTTLSAEDLAVLSDVAWWLGGVDECLEAADAAHRTHLDANRPRAVAMTALDLAVSPASPRAGCAARPPWVRVMLDTWRRSFSLAGRADDGTFSAATLPCTEGLFISTHAVRP